MQHIIASEDDDVVSAHVAMGRTNRQWEDRAIRPWGDWEMAFEAI
jgi:hypothetical protein